MFDARWGHREVALKVLKGEMVPGDRERFLAEARLLIEMTHPGVVKVLAAGSLPDGRPYLAMEKLPGESLARRLGRGPMALPQAITLFVQLCDAVSAMHARALIHRDLKPENVMLVAGPTGEHAVLLDFGIAKLASEGVAAPTQSGLVRGTPAYMAPERFFGHPASVATDVYELAVTLFAMIAGRLPWADTADPEVRLNPTRLGAVAAVPPALDELVARALSTRAPNRPASVADLSAEVVAAAGGAVTPARATQAVRADRSGPVTLPPPEVSTSPSRAVTVRSSPGVAPWPSADRSTTGSAASGERAVLTTRTRRRWPLALVAGLAVAGGAVAIGVASRGEPGARRLITGPDDPWSGEGPAPIVVVDAGDVGPPRLTAEEQAEVRGGLADAMRRHAADIDAVLGVAVAEARRAPELRDLTRAVWAQPLVAGLVADLIGRCELPFGERVAWLSLASVAAGAGFGIYDLVASGAWTRDEIERCARGVTGKVKRGGARDALSIVTGGVGGGTRVLGWLDDHTFFVSNRPDAGAPFVTARLGRRPEQRSRVQALADGIDRRATLWLVAEQAWLGSRVDTAAATGADLTLRLTLGERDDVDEPVAGVQLALYYADEPAAKAGLAAVEALRDGAKETLGSNVVLSLASDFILPPWQLLRNGTMVQVAGQVPEGLVAKLQRVAIDQFQ